MSRFVPVWAAALCAGLLALAPPTAAQPDVVPFGGCNEPHTAVVNPLNPQNVAVAECNVVAVSTDFGRTFTLGFQNTTTLPAGIAAGTWTSCGDPSLAFDAQGRLFWTYLLCGDYAPADGNRDEITAVVAQINPTTGALIGNPVDITPGQFNDDKQWIVADAAPSSPFANNLYVVWSRLGTNQVMFVRSTNQGVTWSAPTAVSAGTDPGFLWPSHIAVARNGDIYVGYHSDTCGAATASMFILRDSSGGVNLAGGTAVQKTSFPSATTCNVQNPGPPVNFGGGPAIPNTDFWLQGTMQPWILPDPVRPGNVYVVANDDPDDNFATGDPGEVILARSTDHGNNWSISTISHPPAGTLQAMPTAAIDQDGKIVSFWYDTRRGILNNNGTPADTTDDYFNLDAYATVSRDGGLSFTNDFRINDAQFDPNQGAPCRTGCGGMADPGPATLRIGEYNGVAAANGNAYAAWTGNQAGGQAMFFDVFSMDAAYPDRFEPNDSIQPGVPTDLGQHPTYSEPELTVHTELDEDFFRVTALATGRLRFELAQNPRLADLDIQVRDRFNQAIGTASPALDSNPAEAVTIPAVAGQSYFVRVFAQPGELPATAVYDLNVVNTAAPVPVSIALAPGSDTGRNPNDNVTNTTTPTIALLVDQDPLDGLALSPTPNATLSDDAPGYKVGVFVNGNLDGFAAAGPGPGTYTYTLSGAPPVVDGLNSVTARVFIVDPSDDPATAGTTHAVGQGGQSNALLVTIDTIAPATPAPPDLLPASDTGGIDDDNITTVQQPHFAGTGEPNALARLFADGLLIGSGVLNTSGGYEITTSSVLGDGVYDITIQYEDLAGNLSTMSAPLKVTIAHDSLTLPGQTASGPAAGPVTVDLGADTISGYPGIAGATGDIGILGIPLVLFETGGQDLTVLGTAGDDGLTYTPATATSGSLTRAGVGQTLRFSGVADLQVDPAAGNDVVTVVGTANADPVEVNVDTNTTARVNTTLLMNMPALNVERLAISTLAGQDTVTVNARDTVDAFVTVDAGDPAPAPSKQGDQLNVNGTSPRASVQNAPGGPTPGSGVATVSYPRTTNHATTVEYSFVEKVKLSKV